MWPTGDMKWKNGRDYMRLDGTTPQQQRQRLVDHFNDEGSDARLLLISTRAGNLGLHLPPSGGLAATASHR